MLLASRVPNQVAALFFLTYESIKQASALWHPALGDSPWTLLFAASLAEVVVLASDRQAKV